MFACTWLGVGFPSHQYKVGLQVRWILSEPFIPFFILGHHLREYYNHLDESKILQSFYAGRCSVICKKSKKKELIFCGWLMWVMVKIWALYCPRFTTGGIAAAVLGCFAKAQIFSNSLQRFFSFSAATSCLQLLPFTLSYKWRQVLEKLTRYALHS